MKVLIVSIEFPPGPGGMGTLAYQAADHFSNLGWQVHVSAPQRHAADDEIEQFNRRQLFKITSFTYKGPFLFEVVDRLWKLLNDIYSIRPDIILAVGRQAAWLGKFGAQFACIPLVVTGIGSEFLVTGYQRFLTRWAYQSADLVLFISQFVRGLAVSQGFRIHRQIVIPPGADDNLFQPNLSTNQLREELGLKNAKVILTVGQISHRKAQDIVIRALPRVIARFPEAVYVAVGLPTECESFQKLALDLGIADKVIFTGRIPQRELPYYFNLADVYVMVSRRTLQGSVEGFGIAAVEAALCGKPAVVSDDSGLLEAVVPGRTALVAIAEDPVSTADAIITLLENKELYNCMCKEALKYSRQNATWRKRMDEYAIVLQGLAQRD